MNDLVVGQVRGYRAWVRDAAGLAPVTYRNHPWTLATARAICTAGGKHPAPAAGCTCGLYAYYRPTTVPQSDRQVFGVVAAEGRVVLATRGMKAERMTMLALVTDDEALGEQYGVPIYPSREALLSDYPPQDYSGLVDVDPTDPPDFSAVTLRLSATVRQFGKAMSQATAEIQRLMASTGTSMADCAEKAREAESTREDVMARALEARKRRNTGPAVGRYRLDGRR